MSAHLHFGGRSLARIQALQLLFQAEVCDRSVREVLRGAPCLEVGPLDPYAERLALGVEDSRDDLDAVIAARAENWSIGRMPAVDRNLLRIALYEMLSVSDVDVAVAIDECVELAKAYGTEESPRFVNGLLGRVADQIEAGENVVDVSHKLLDTRNRENNNVQD